MSIFAPSLIAFPAAPVCDAFRCTASAPTHEMRYFVNDLRSPKLTASRVRSFSVRVMISSTVFSFFPVLMLSTSPRSKM
eukprot:3495094-Rhodomonas_salina.1